jgi:hypothetical protein
MFLEGIPTPRFCEFADAFRTLYDGMAEAPPR